MTVAFDASSSSSGTGVVSLSFTHTPVGTPTAVGVMATTAFGNSTAPTVTYGGAAVNSGTVAETSYFFKDWVMGLANPSSGAQTVSVTPSSTVDVIAGSVTVTGSDTSTCFSGAGVAAQASGTTVTANCPSASGELVIGVYTSNNSGTSTPGSGQTNTIVLNTSNYRARGGYKAATGNPETMSWTMSASQQWNMVAQSFKDAAAAGGASHRTIGGGHGGRFIGA